MSANANYEHVYARQTLRQEPQKLLRSSTGYMRRGVVRPTSRTNAFRRKRQMERNRQAGSGDAAGASFVGELRWFPIDLDKQTGAINFADIGLERPKWQELLEIAAGDRRPAQKSLPAAAAFKLVTGNPAPPRVNFIWHTSYCCSTAIAAALDVPGRNLSLFEPQILISVAQARRQADRLRRGDISWLSDAVFRLLGRSYFEGASVTVKPAPVSNYLAADAAAKTRGKMLFLYSDCRSFLLASMRYGENRRRTIRHLFNEIRHDGEAAERWTAESIAGLTDLEIAGLTWQMQIARFAKDLKRFGDRAASLDCDAFLAAPQEVIARIWKFFELPGDASESELIQDPEFLLRHSKYPDLSFALDARFAAERDLDPAIRVEIDRIVEASCALLPDPAAMLPLARPLATVEKAYNI